MNKSQIMLVNAMYLYVTPQLMQVTAVFSGMEEVLENAMNNFISIIKDDTVPVDLSTIFDSELDGFVDDIDHLGNRIISDIYRVNSIKIRLIRQELTRIQPAIVLSVIGEHMKIIAALNTRDPVRAQAALGEHLENSRKRALRI